MKILPVISAALCLAALQSCFTGIESTPRISDSEVRRETPRTRPESSFLKNIRPERLDEWKPGKQWYVIDAKIRMVLGPSGTDIAVTSGDTVTYEGIRQITTVTGEPVAEILLRLPSGRQAVYRTSQSEARLREAQQVDIPFAVELSVVDAVRSKLKGNKYYIITSSWYDTDMQSFTGRRFVPVTVDEVSPGNSYYPILLSLTDEKGKPFRLYMTSDSESRMPRRFDSLFSLTDPRREYPAILDSTWQNIIAGRVAEGMTRDECRLAIGSPSSVDRRTGYSYIMEVWTYENGVYLMFEDGLLKSFRQ